MHNKVATPFLKWAGGKGQLLDEFKKLYPPELKTGQINRYVEPFVGGGAVFFNIVQNYDVNEYYINDTNQDLILTYKVIKKDVKTLIDRLAYLRDSFLGMPDEKKDNFYYDIREQFNKKNDTIDFINYSNAWSERAAELIFLNKTCFNGLYRVNSKGKFNVPFGKYKNPAIFDRENLIEISKVLSKTIILCGDFSELEQFIDEHSFVYFDPPYKPLTASSSFTSYTKEDFGDKEQERLAEFYKALIRKNAKLMLSNSDMKNVDEDNHYFDNLYKYSDEQGNQRIQIQRVKASRMINSKANGRNAINELVIVNYGVEQAKENVQKGVERMKETKLFKEKLGLDTSEQIFKYLLSSLKESIKGWDYFVNWDKAISNIREIEIDLNLLNYLIGKENVREDFAHLLSEYPRIVKLIPILIACRDKSFSILNFQDDKGFEFEHFDFKGKKELSAKEIDDAVDFVDNAGVLSLFKDKTIKNVVDYVLGIEVGLDSNGRKNRSGTSMERLVEKFILSLCERHSYSYIKQATSKRIMDDWGIKVTVDKSERRFDFAINNNQSLYLIEVNYYGGGGSKLKATAGEYKALYDFIKNDNHKFIWVTDGLGWNTAARPLEETFNHIDYIVNLDLIEKGLFEEIITNNL